MMAGMNRIPRRASDAALGPDPSAPLKPPSLAGTEQVVRAGTPLSGAAAAGRRRAAAWRRELQQAVRSPAELARRLQIPLEALAGSAADRFPVLVPESFLARIVPGDPADPLLLQVLARPAELDPQPGFVADPVGDRAAQRQPGLLHKYASRVLLMASSSCAVHCRYCFRRNYPYADEPRSDADWEPALEAIAADPSLHEVILSGGDPLTLSDARLRRLARRLAAVPSLRRLRVHTRLPVVIPSRVTGELLDWLTGTRLAPVLVIHANHARELDAAVARGLQRLRRAGVMLLNQAVLLRGVNDDVAALVALSERLADVGVAPYYLHQLDRVAGGGAFETSREEGRRLVAELRTRLPGYLVPRYVEEVAGAPAKVPLD
jgi:EF-P beta-lysylation protein EpmB